VWPESQPGALLTSVARAFASDAIQSPNRERDRLFEAEHAGTTASAVNTAAVHP
jgi:hypothetical protein